MQKIARAELAQPLAAGGAAKMTITVPAINVPSITVTIGNKPAPAAQVVAATAA